MNLRRNRISQIKRQLMLIMSGLLVICTNALALPWDGDVKTEIPFRYEKSSQSTQQNLEKFLVFLLKANQDRSWSAEQQLREYYAQDVEYSINGVTVAHNLRELTARSQRISSHLKQYEFKNPSISAVAKNMGVVSYHLNETRKSGEVYHNLITAMVTYKDNKIVKWDAVVEHLAH